jgi:hypothetical protein
MSNEEKEYVTVIHEGDPDYQEMFTNLGRMTVHSPYPFSNTSFALYHASEIKNGRLAILSSGEYCRETFFGTVKNYLWAEKTRRVYTSTGWSSEPNPNCEKGRLLERSANIFVPAIYPYPRLKEIRTKNKEMAAAFWNGALVAKRVLNYLEELAEWEERTSVYGVRITNMLPKKNHGSLFFSGASQWFNTPYNFSLYLLICRLSMNHFIVNDKITDVKSLVKFLKGKLSEIEAFYTYGNLAPYLARRVVNDAKMVISTAWSWETLVKSYKEIYKKETRRSTLAFYRAYSYNTTGVYSLCKSGVVDNSPEHPVLTKQLETLRPKSGIN